ncbi:MAG: hypothetical protein ACTHNL_17495 [Devosia sp.]
MNTTRTELYNQIWSRPMTKVAADYGVTSTALKKTCTRHEIPTPDRGYWAKLQYGKAVAAKPALPPASSPNLETVHIVGVIVPTLPQSVVEAENTARARLAPEADPSLEDVPEPKILASTRRAISKALPDEAGFSSISGKDLVSLTVAAESVERSLAFLARLFASANGQGFAPRPGDDGLVMIVEGEQIAFAVEEQTEKTPHVQTAEDRRLLAEHERWGWAPRVRKYDHVPSGRLALLINVNPYGGLRRKFADGRTQRLENMIPEILVNMAGHAALIQETRRKEEEDRRRRQEAETRRRLQEAFASRQKEREAFIDAIHSQLTNKAKFVAVLAYLETLEVDQADQVSVMIHWLKDRIGMIDALIGAHGLDLTVRNAEITFAEPEDPAVQGRVKYFSRFQDLRLWSPYTDEGVATSQTPYEWTLAQKATDQEQINPGGNI